jgi:methionyl-tRNA synthetase
MKYYLTTTLPYVNADPHIGFALEIVQADMICRWRRLLGDEVIFNTGTDEHGQKIYKNAMEAGVDPKTYCDGFAAQFGRLKDSLNLTYTNFIRTTDEHHVAAAQEFWRRCAANGDIYKKQYQVKYCVGCELEKSDSELTDGVCPWHPKYTLELRDEENYFFRWSNYGERLLALYAERPDFVVPAGRLNEIASFVRGGLNDFSISRLKTKMPWGIEVPGDADHVMYVWFDALVNYISTLGWPDDEASFNAAWPGTQVAGKDNLRQQSAMWQAMLMSANIAPSKQIFIHGFIGADGQKMSKSLGNVVNPLDLVAAYSADAVRYYLLGGLPAYEDGDYTKKHFEETYTSKLVNGAGNLAARTCTMVEKYCAGAVPAVQLDRFDTPAFWSAYAAALKDFRFDEALRALERYVTSVNQAIDTEAPFKKAKLGEDVSPFMYQIAEAVRHIGMALLPVTPAAAEKMLASLGVSATSVSFPADQAWGGLKPGAPVVKGEILFPRLAEPAK